MRVNVTCKLVLRVVWLSFSKYMLRARGSTKVTVVYYFLCALYVLRSEQLIYTLKWKHFTTTTMIVTVMYVHIIIMWRFAALEKKHDSIHAQNFECDVTQNSFVGTLLASSFTHKTCVVRLHSPDTKRRHSTARR